MSDELTMKTKGIRGLIAALDVEKPHPSKVNLYKKHPKGILTNDGGVPVMPIYRIVEVVLAAALPEGDLFVWCPDCEGVGEIGTVAHDPTLSEAMRPCTRCDDHSGMVKVELAVMSDQTRQAIDIIARWALHNAAEKWMEDGWENLPDFCEADYVRVEDRMMELLVPDVSVDEFGVAHRVLADRAGTTI